MLNTVLERDGVNLSFSNLLASTPALYVDVGNNRVGINNSSPAYTLDVTGTINANSNITGANISTAGNVTAGNVITASIYGNTALSFYTTSNGNILLTPNGTGISKAVGTNGFVIPAGNTSQRPGTPDTGTLRFNTQTIQTEIWDGAEWVTATGSTSAITNQTLNGDGSTVAFTLNYSAVAESILVTVNGVLQTPGVDYTTTISPNIITFTTAPLIADTIQVRFIASTSVIASLLNGTSNVAIPVSNGNVVISSGGSPNVLSVASTGANITGYANVTGNITGGNLSLTGNIVNANITGNISVGNITSGNLSLTGNISVANVTGNVVGANVVAVNATYTPSIVNTGANGTGNIGSATTYFNTVFAKATSAQYADLAECYSADAEYAPGTVVSFGGDREITLATADADPCVAGVVSTNPSYIMNAGIFAEFPTQVALTGRVPCRVTGPVTKGAMMVSAGNGTARAESSPAMGTVIGKALEAFDGAEGVIEIVVGRL